DVTDINAENCLIVVEGGRGRCIGPARSPWDWGLVVFPLVNKVFSGRCHTKGGSLPDENGLVCGLSNNHRRRYRSGRWSGSGSGCRSGRRSGCGSRRWRGRWSGGGGWGRGGPQEGGRWLP